MPLQRLVQCLQSLEFSRVVATSLALSIIFHGGNFARSVAQQFEHTSTTRVGTESADSVGGAAGSHNAPYGATGEKAQATGSKMSAAGPADIPSLLPVFIDTFSAPAPEPEAEEEEIEIEVEEEDEDGGGDEGQVLLAHGQVLTQADPARSPSLSPAAAAASSSPDRAAEKEAGDVEGEGDEEEEVELRGVGIAFQASSDSSAGDARTGTDAETETERKAERKAETEAERDGGGTVPTGSEKPKKKKTIKVRRVKDASGPVPSSAPAAAVDWISKLDFLEFCQAVVDVKRYSVCA